MSRTDEFFAELEKRIYLLMTENHRAEDVNYYAERRVDSFVNETRKLVKKIGAEYEKFALQFMLKNWENYCKSEKKRLRQREFQNEEEYVIIINDSQGD